MHSLIITCAGSGSRLGLGYNKMLYIHEEEYLFNITIKKFLDFNFFKEIILIVPENELKKFEENVISDSRIIIVSGSTSRQNSVYQGVKVATGEFIWIHDGARCFISKELIEKLYLETKANNALALGVKSKDSLRKILNNDIIGVIDRETTCLMQTPQICKADILKETFSKLENKLDQFTDEVGMLLENGQKVHFVEGSYENIKITTKEDLRNLYE